LSYEKIDTTHDGAREREMMERSRRQTVPQVFADGLSIGGYDDLARLNATDERDGVFIEIGLAAGSDYALDLMETNARGEIHVDRELETRVRGVFAAGDVIDVIDGRDKQVIIAAAEGAKADADPKESSSNNFPILIVCSSS